MPKIVDESLCWKCKNACGGCCWSSELKPVDNWVAEKTDWSYFVKSCPCYEAINRPLYQKIPLQEVARLLRTDTKTVTRLCEHYIIHKMKSLGYDVFIEEAGKKREYFLLQ